MVVIDAAVVYKWFDSEEIWFDKAIELLNKHLDKKDLIVAPDLILYELANAWSTKTPLSINKIEENLKLLESYHLNIIDTDFNLMGKAVKFSRKYHISVYDAAYAILAKEKKCDLITADERFVEKVKLKFIKKLKDSS